MNRAVIYTRVSENVTESEPLQRQACRQYCNLQGLEIVNQFEDVGVPGTSRDRPGLQGLLAFCRDNHPGVNAVVVFDQTRLNRQARDYEATHQLFSQLGVRLILVEE